MFTQNQDYNSIRNGSESYFQMVWCMSNELELHHVDCLLVSRLPSRICQYASHSTQLSLLSRLNCLYRFAITTVHSLYFSDRDLALKLLLNFPQVNNHYHNVDKAANKGGRFDSICAVLCDYLRRIVCDYVTTLIHLIIKHTCSKLR